MKRYLANSDSVYMAPGPPPGNNKKSGRIFFLVGMMLLFVLFSSSVRADSGAKYLSKALYYQTLLEFTCQLQIDYYREFSAYLQRAKASEKPLLIPYYTGLGYFETGKYRQAVQVFEEASATLAASDLPPSIQIYRFYSQVMQAASLYREGEEEQLEKFTKKGKTFKSSESYFLGYILLRLNYKIDLARDLLADCPDKHFGEVTGKWISYKLGVLPLKDLRIAKYKLKKPEFEENYSKIKLTKSAIDINIKYFNPAEIQLLKEISLYKTLESLDSTENENFALLGWANFLLGDFKKAINFLEKYQQAFPLDLSVSVRMGEYYNAVNNHRKADRLWNWAKSSGGIDVKRELALILSTIKEKQQKALGLLKETKDKGIEKNIRFDAAYYRKYRDYYQAMGRIYLNQDKFKKAGDTLMLLYERSKKEQPRKYNQIYLVSLGYALAKTRRYKEAIDYALKGAASVNPAAYQAFHAVNYGLYMLGYE